MSTPHLPIPSHLMKRLPREEQLCRAASLPVTPVLDSPVTTINRAANDPCPCLEIYITTTALANFPGETGRIELTGLIGRWCQAPNVHSSLMRRGKKPKPNPKKKKKNQPKKNPQQHTKQKKVLSSYKFALHPSI